MKYLVTSFAALLILLTSCDKIEKDQTHSEVMYQMAVDTLESINDLYAAIVYYGDDEIGFYWNSPDYYCANIESGSCDTTAVTPLPDSLNIDYEINFIRYQEAIRTVINIPYSFIDSFTTSSPVDYYSNREVFIIHVNREEGLDLNDNVEHIPL